MNEITIRKPFDAHLHLRDEEVMKAVLPHTVRQFWGGIIMPNLVPPVTTVFLANGYHLRILEALPRGMSFNAYMTLYLTDDTSPDEIDRIAESRWIKAVKYYPAHGTTNSAAGVTDLKNAYPVLERMQKRNVPLCLHGEVTDRDVDVFDREVRFIEAKLMRLRREFPGLKIVLEHITTKEAVDYILSEQDPQLAATITAHHLVANRNDMLADGMKPHYYCKPILKHRRDQQALRYAATHGNLPFFLGTDSAPHSVHAKECENCAAGAFTAPIAMELYTEVFDEERKLENLEWFASVAGPAFYGLEPSAKTITLERKEWMIEEPVFIQPSGRVPGRLLTAKDTVKPFLYGEKRPIKWKMKE